MEKATYSLSALKQCKELIRKNRWSTRLKAEHNSRCAEVNVLLASPMVDFATVPADLMTAFQLIPYQNAEDAVFKALGVE